MEGIILFILLAIFVVTLTIGVVSSMTNKKQLGPVTRLQQTPPAAAAPGATPAATAVTTQSSKRWWWSAVARWRSETPIELVILSIVGGIIVIYFNWGAQFAGFPIWSIVIAFVAIVIFFGGTIKTRAIENQQIAVVGLFVALLYVLVWVFYPEYRPVMETPAAVGALLLVMVAYSFFVIIKKVFWEESPLTALIMLLVLLAFLEPAVTRILPPSMKEHLASYWRGGGVTRTANIPSNGCSPVAQHSIAFGSAPVRVNPEGRCGLDMWHDGHCVWVKRASWTNDQRAYNVCHGGGVRDVEWAWSADTPFTGAVALTQPRYH